VRRSGPERCAGAAILAIGLLAGCSMFGGRNGTPDNEPTLKTLAGRDVPVQRDRTVASSMSGRAVRRTNTDADGGSSSVCSSAFCAAATSASA